MTAHLPPVFWRAQRPVVDTARSLVARLRPPPPPPIGGPLGTAHARQVLAFLDAHPLVQPDRTSCGSSTLTVLRMLRNPSYAAVVLDAPDPDRVFARAALGVRQRTNAAVDAAGHLQLPWPAALGVRPAAMVRLLDAADGFGALGRRHHNVVVDPAAPGRVYDAILASVRAGEPVPFYVGNGHWMQHIVLVVAAEPDRLTLYDPAVGGRAQVLRADFEDDRMNVAGWARPWLAILGS